MTGSHAFKTGVQWGFGDYVIDRDINGDLVQLYRNGVPDSVRVYNTPVRSNEYLNADLGLYAQDSWTLRNVTLNMGVRFDYMNGQISQQHLAAGRFVPERVFPETPNMPSGSTWRRGSVSHTIRSVTAGPRSRAPSTSTWPARRSVRAALQSAATPDRYPHMERPEPRQHRAGQRDRPEQRPEIRSAVLLRRPGDEPRPRVRSRVQRRCPAPAPAAHCRSTRAYFRRGVHNMVATTPTQFSRGDYTIVNVVSPLDGSIIPLYNLDPNKNGLLDRVDNNSTDSDLVVRPTTASSSAPPRGSARARSSAAGPSTAGFWSTATRSRTGRTCPTRSTRASSRTRTSRSPTTTTAIRASTTFRSFTSSSSRAPTGFPGSAFKRTPRSRATRARSCPHGGTSAARPATRPIAKDRAGRVSWSSRT